jgi:4-amino-4-deoxy-L-arabinose transferase-like glycosyltransferase
LAGVVLGLFIGRMWAESQMSPVPALSLLLVTGASSLLGALLAWGLSRLRLQTWPLLLLLVYAAWPMVAPSVAWWTAGVSLVLLLLANLPTQSNWPVEWPVGIMAFAAYVWTLAPGLLPADSGEFQFVSHVLGIAHPPGYPLYTMLGKLTALLPIGSVAWRVNLLSAVFAALTLALVARAVRRMTGSPVAGLASALALGGITTFWAQATTANIRSLMAMFTASLLLLTLEYGAKPSQRTLLALGAAAGLAVGHHGSLALLFLPIAVYLLLADRQFFKRPRWLLAAAGAFLASLLVLLYLPIRSLMGAPFDPAPIHSVSRFLEHILASGFKGDMFYFARAEFLPGRIGVWLNILRMEFGVPLALALGLAGLFVLARKPKVFILVGGISVVNTATAITYRAPQTVEYLIPSYVALALMLGMALGEASAGLLRRAVPRAALAAAVLAMCAAPWVANAWSFHTLSRDDSTAHAVRNLLQAAPPNATVLTNWHWATPMWYLQYVEGARPDVEVVYVHPEGATPNEQVWIRRIGEGLKDGAVIATNWFEAYKATPYRFVWAEGGWQVLDAPMTEAPAGIQPVEQMFDGKIRIIGFRVSETETAPGKEVRVRLYWQPVVPLEGNYSFFVHLVGASGQVLGQSDLTHRGEGFQSGEVVADEHRLSILPEASEGEYRVVVGTYITLPDGWKRLQTPDGQDAVQIAAVRVHPATEPPVTRHPMRQRFAGGLTLWGVDWDAAGSGALYLHWRGEGLPAGDYAVQFVRGGTLVSEGIVHVPAEPAFFTSAHVVPYGEGWLSIRLHDVAGKELLPLGPWGRVWGDGAMLPHFYGGERYVNLGGEMFFAGFDAPPPQEVTAGGTLRASLRFISLKPLVKDYSVSLAVSGESGTWTAQHDTTPALGAIPTLKWTRGVTVDDPHALEIPAGAEGKGTLYLTVYDAFTLQPLPILDAELARLGQGQHLKVGEVGVR